MPATSPTPKVSTQNRRASEAQSRIAAILGAARELFGRKGYEATSLREVLERSGGSKATLRKYFSDKPGLFAAVVSAVTSEFVASARFAEAEGPPAAALRDIGRSVLRFYVRQDALQSYRGVVAGGHRDVRMARSFYEKGHVTVRDALARRLAEWEEAGLIASPDCSADADHFLHLLRAVGHEQALLGLRKSVPTAEIDQRVERAVQIFLGGVARPAGRG